MKRWKRILGVFLAVVMCTTSIMPTRSLASEVSVEEQTETDVQPLSTKNVTEGKKIFAEDFEDESGDQMTKWTNNVGVIEVVKEDGNEDNKVLHMKQLAETNNYIALATGIASEADSVVYDFDIKLLSEENAFSVYLKNTNSDNKWLWLTQIKDGIWKTLSGGKQLTDEKFETGTWYNIAFVCDYVDRICSIYLNGTKLETSITINETFGNADVVNYIYFEGQKGTLNHTEFYLDNIRVYEGTKPCEEFASDKPVISVTEGKKIFTADFEKSNPMTMWTNNVGVIEAVKEDGVESNTVLHLKQNSADNNFIARAEGVNAEADSVVYDFDIKLLSEQNTISISLRNTNSSDAWLWLTRVKNGTWKTSTGGVELSKFETAKWYNIAFVCNYVERTCSIWLDGVELETKIAISESFGDADIVKYLYFEVPKGTLDGTEFYLDNIRVYEGTKPCEELLSDKKPVNVGTEGGKIAVADFESSNKFTLGAHDNNIIEWIQEPGNTENKVLHFKRTGMSDFVADMTGLGVDYDSIVYEFDVKIQNEGNNLIVVQLKDTNTTVDAAKYTEVCRIKNNQLGNGSSFSEDASLETGRWYTISVVYDYVNRVRSIYLDKTLVLDEISMETAFGDAENANLIRFNCPPNQEDTTEFLIDNVRVYEGTKPCDELKESEVTITIDENKSIFTQEGYAVKYGTSQYDELLKGYVALHTRSGIVYKDGVKTLLKTAPVATEDGYLVAVEEICAALGISAAIEAETVDVDGQTMINAQYFFETVLGKVVSVDTKAKSDGMMIAGDTAFSWPTGEYDMDNVFFNRTDIQNLNDYLFFERPSAEKVLTDYQASASNGAHPRIMATAEDFAVIRQEAEQNALKKEWYEQIILSADNLVTYNTTVPKYELSDGVRLLGVVNEVMSHMYTLGMAYQLTGEQKYVDRAWVDLEAVSNFVDWHPQHDLDPAEMCLAVAIGYDWMYDGLTEAQRETIEKGMYKNGFYDAAEAYQSSTGKLGAAVLSGINHNLILNACFAIGAEAFMDVYPEESSYILSGAIHAIDIAMTEYGPDGAWKEGPHYYHYGTQFAIKMLNSLETIFGTCYGLDLCEGLSTAADYTLNIQSDQGIFNYGDGTTGTPIYAPECFYLSNKYGNESVTATLLELSQGKMSNNEDIVLSLLWYDTGIQAEDIEMPLDAVYWTEGVATFRDAWTSDITAYAAIHGGQTQMCHGQVDGGTFVYDYAGVRWAKELGSTPYDTTVTAQYGLEGGRWLLYRSRAEAHNTIVINPDESAGQKLDSTAKMIRFESEDRGGIAVLDMSENYADNAERAVRGFFFTDDRTGLVIRDEISLKEKDGGSEVYWFMQTDAEVTIAADGKSATLTQAGKQVELEFVTSGTAQEVTLGVGPSTRALLGSTSPINVPASSNTNAYDVEDAATNRIYIKLSGASGDVSVTVKLSPAGTKISSVEDYDMSIADWKVAEGTIAAKPQIERAVIEGRELKFNSANSADYLIVEGTREDIPEVVVTVDESKYTYTVTNATEIDGTTTILIKDKEHPETFSMYTVAFHEIPVAKVPEGFSGTALQVVATEASAEPEANKGFVAWKTLDQDTDSRWTSQGSNNWILYELEEKSEVEELVIWFKNGHIRSTYFDVSVSTDGETYTKVWSGMSKGTAIGSAEGYESVCLDGVEAKYIKIGCNGNTAQGTAVGWNNIGEVVFTGTVCEKEDSTVTPPGGDKDTVTSPDDQEDTMTPSEDHSSPAQTPQSGAATGTGDTSGLGIFTGISVMMLLIAGWMILSKLYKKE